jgi:biopolymer transport protein ExbD
MRRTRRRAPDLPIDIQLPITPMLDMSFQLLAFFVITFKAASASEGQLDVALPRPVEPRAKDPTQIDLTRQTSADAEDGPEVTITLTANGAGELTGITLHDSADKTIAGATPAELCAGLKDELRKLRSAGGVRIEAAAKLRYARLVDAMDACLAAGVRRIGFAPPPDYQPRNR